MNIRRVLLIICPAVLLCSVGHAQVVINEVHASNWTGITDSYGEREDWIELYNTGATPFDLSGWWLSDSENNNMKWQVPAGVTVPANGYLVVFCSGRNEMAGTQPHTNFRISQCQEERAVLSDPGGTIVDQFQFLQQTQTDHSWGRTTNGASTWSIFLTPTPGAANTGASPSYYATKPTMSPAGGYHAGPVSVTLSSPDPNVTIRYTLDGTTPTTASPAYAGPINVPATAVVKARAFSATPGVPPSFVEFNTYFVGVTHTIPIISAAGDQLLALMNGNGGLRPVASLEYFGADGTLWDKAVGDFNEHGQDSWAYDQRGVDYITRDDFGYNDAIHHQIFRITDRPSFQRLIIKAAAGDNYDYGPGQPAHIRDAYVQSLSQMGDLRLDERSYEPAVLYINGQYWGVYDVREKVDDHDFTSYYYNQGKYEIQFIKTWGGTWSEYGGAQAEADWNALRTYIGNNNMGDPAAFAYVESQFNWKSLVDYFCLNSYTVCADWLNWNTGWWRGLNPAGEHKKWGYILWDMDATFGHYINFTGIPDQGPTADPCTVENLPNPGGQGHTDILEKLIAENPMVRNYYVNRYIDLGNTLFSCDFMLPYLDSLIGNIAPEMPAQINRWNGTLAGWQNNVQVLRNFIEQRCVLIQDGMVDCYDLTGPFPVAFDVYPPNSGRIRINSITPAAYAFHGDYYGNIATNLEPIPNTGWTFSHWESTGGNTILPSTTDSLVTVDILGPDSIVAHFVPPVSYEVFLDVDPRPGGTITFNGTTYTDFPTTVNVPEGVAIPFTVNPAPYYDFLHWTVATHAFTPNDSTERTLSVSFFAPDTIIAHLKPQEYVYFVPNAFTPNGDGINDLFLPLGNAIDLDTYRLEIYDRWGELLYESRKPEVGWDGTASGKEMPDGVYVYRAYVMDAITKKRHELFGHVTLFR